MNEEVDNAEFIQIGWISHGMDVYKHDDYAAMFKRGKGGTGLLRKPPKIYKTEQIANKYGKAQPVFIKKHS
jgi:hypothetical protein